jgi:hypothetical protein
MSELTPISYLYRLVKFWWIVILCTLIGGGAGFAFSRLNPPIYEAKAIFHVSLDLEQMAQIDPPLGLNEEDIALASVHGTIMHPDVVTSLFAEANSKGIFLTWEEITLNYTIERKNTIWELRYRSTDSQVAHTVVNIWAAKTYDKVILLQTEQKIPGFVIINPPLIPDLPGQPVYFNLIQLLLAGGMIGFLIALFIVDLLASGRIGRLAGSM